MAALAVEQIVLALRVHQTLMSVLTVNIHQQFTQFAQLSQGCSAAIDVAAVATLLVDQSTQDQLVRDIEVTLAQPALNVLFTIEVRADFSARTALADGFGIAACPQHQGE